MRLNFALIGFALTGLASAPGAAQEDTSNTYPTDWEGSSEQHGQPEATPEPDENQEHASARLQVHCRSQNDFGYIATASGTLSLGGRTPYNSVAVSGGLELDSHFIDAPSQPRHIELQGTIDLLGQYLFADVTRGADDLASVFFAFGANSSSYVQAKDGTQYQTECSSSHVRLPEVADLTATKKLRFEPLPDGRQRAPLEVLNIGNTTLTGPAARIRLAGLDLDGTLYNAARTQHALSTGEQGYIEVDVPAGTLTRCGSYALILDLEHKLQSGAFDPFANDAAEAQTPCLRWNTPITEEALGGPVDPLIAYKTLDGIVNSQEIARRDGLRCNACHYAGSGKPYSPPAGTITPSLPIGAHAWSGYDGWAYEFYNQPDMVKPGYLKAAFRRWLDDGGQ